MKKQKGNKNNSIAVVPSSKMELEKVLTDKQTRFCLEYLKDLNATSAAKRSGYSDKTAYSIGQENLKKPEIEKYIEILKSEIVKRTEIDIDYIIKHTTDIIEKSMQLRPVLDRDGNPVLVQTANGQLAAAYIFDGKTALTGLSLLAEHIPGWKVAGDDKEKGSSIEIILNNYLGQPNNTYFPVTPETEHLARLLGVDPKRKN